MNIINSNINTININNINSITSLTDVNNILKTAQNQKIKILDSFWEALYKDKCSKYFMPLSKVVSELEFWAINFHDNMNELKIASFLNDYHNTLYPIYIPDILELYRKYDFKIVFCPFIFGIVVLWLLIGFTYWSLWGGL